MLRHPLTGTPYNQTPFYCRDIKQPLVTCPAQSPEEQFLRIRKVKTQINARVAHVEARLGLMENGFQISDERIREGVRAFVMVTLSGGYYQSHFDHGEMWCACPYASFEYSTDCRASEFYLGKLVRYESKQEFESVAEQVLIGIEKAIEHDEMYPGKKNYGTPWFKIKPKPGFAMTESTWQGHHPANLPTATAAPQMTSSLPLKPAHLSSFPAISAFNLGPTANPAKSRTSVTGLLENVKLSKPDVVTQPETNTAMEVDVDDFEDLAPGSAPARGLHSIRE